MGGAGGGGAPRPGAHGGAPGDHGPRGARPGGAHLRDARGRQLAPQIHPAARWCGLSVSIDQTEYVGWRRSSELPMLQLWQASALGPDAARGQPSCSCCHTPPKPYMHGHIQALNEEEAQSCGLPRAAGLALEAPAGLASDSNQQQSAAETDSKQRSTSAEPQPGAGDQPREAAEQAAGQQEAAAAQGVVSDGGLAAAAAGHPVAGAGETADELQPQSAADQAAAEQLMKEEVSRGGAALQEYPSGFGRLSVIRACGI
jgi:hypothetical protein